MSDFPWLSVLIALPLLGALLVGVLPRGREALVKQTALGVSVLVAVLTLVMAARFDSGGTRFQFEEKYWWIKQFGVHWAVGVDGVALVLVVLSVILVPLVMLASWSEADRSGGVDVPPKRSVKTYFALLLALEAAMIGVFVATDVFLFYVFFEAMLIPVYFIIGSYGGLQRSYAAVKFLLYSLLGGLVMLVAVIWLYPLSAKSAADGGLGHGTFLFSELSKMNIDPTTAKWLFLGFFLAFAIKAPMVPVHTWLPDAAQQSPAGALVLIVGVLDKVGTYGMLRFCLELFPGAAKWATPVVLGLAVLSIIYGAVLAIGQVDLKRLIAYTSVSHFGFIVLGIFAMTSQGQSGATLYMVNHGFSTGALFLIVGFMIVRRRSARIGDFGGVQKVAPVLAGTFLVSRPVRAVAAGPVAVRVGVPGVHRHVQPVPGARRDRHHRDRAGRRLHPVDVPADDGRPVHREGPGHDGPVRAGEVGAGPDHRDHRGDGRVPAAGAERDQPIGQADAGPGRPARPGAEDHR